jgi:hypothetical protein
MSVRYFLIPLLALTLLFAGCAVTPPYVYHYDPNRTAVVANGLAYAPPAAPQIVRDAIAAGNQIAGMPYRYGGGHGSFYDSGYDCSGSTSYVLHAIDRLRSPMPSGSFRNYGQSGYGRWITIYARRGHVFLVVAGLRFDTGWGDGDHGPRWTTHSRRNDHYALRHPGGL